MYLALEKIHKMGWTGRMNFVGKTPKMVDDKMRRAISGFKVPRRHVKLKTLIVMLAEKGGRMERPSDEAIKGVQEIRSLKETREEAKSEKLVTAFKKRVKKAEKTKKKVKASASKKMKKKVVKKITKKKVSKKVVKKKVKSPATKKKVKVAVKKPKKVTESKKKKRK